MIKKEKYIKFWSSMFIEADLTKEQLKRKLTIIELALLEVFGEIPEKLNIDNEEVA